MGNSQSSQRHRNGGTQPFLGPRAVHERDDEQTRESPGRSVFALSRRGILSDSWRRQSQHVTSDHMRHFDQLDDRPYEPEDRPLFHSHHDPPVEHHPARPLNWRHSTMARLGSRLLPDSVARGLTTSGEETAEEGHALRNGLSSRSRPSVYHRRINSASDEPLSTTSPLQRRPNEPRREPGRSSVRRLFYPDISMRNVRDEHDSVRDLAINDQRFDDDLGSLETSRRSGTRLARVRRSLSAPFSAWLTSDRLPATRRLNLSHNSSGRPTRAILSDDADELLSQNEHSSTRAEADDNAPHELDAIEPETRNLLSSSRITSGMSTIRRFPHGLRSRSTRLIRRGEHPPLSQVLQLAAAAIAAQLSGTSVNNPENTNFAGETFDGSIQNFVQTLQEAASAQAGHNLDLNASDGDLPPVNFMRVFQFPNDENGTPLAVSANQQNTNDNHNTHFTAPSDRSVTLVLVGVRSMPNFNDASASENGTLGPSLDTLLSLPFLPPANVLRNGSSGALFRRSDTRTNAHTRRHSMTNFSFPQQYESQRHSRARNLGASRSSVENGLLTPMSESPPGPHPPPSTPADLRSGHATPSRRPSSASAVHTQGLPDLQEAQDSTTDVFPADIVFNAARHRRRSDSEFARRPELSSGNARRNGVVEPDRPPGSTGRSWLIYVVGTNVSPDHPAFTMPSLFTDNPSYEDMQMLSNLLGPVKPPVATQNDVEAAGGLYRVIRRGSGMTVEVMNEGDERPITLTVDDRCLICLSEYEDNDQVRQITTCNHVFHRECIDEVSDTF